MIAQIIRQYEFNLAYAQELVIDLTDEQMTSYPSSGLENHPAFTLGHLVTGSALMLEDLGTIYSLPSGWMELFTRKGPGDPRVPNPDRKIYPSKKVLLDELEKQHRKIKEVLTDYDRSKLNEPFAWRFSKYFPTLMDLLIFMCVS